MKHHAISVDTPIDAALTWGAIHRPLSRTAEYGAMMVRIKTGDPSQPFVYRIVRTYKGMKDFLFIRANTVLPLLISLFRRVRNGRNYAWIHTHPEPPAGCHNDYFSREDIFLRKIRLVRDVILVPFRSCDPDDPDSVKVITLQDPGTWCRQSPNLRLPISRRK